MDTCKHMAESLHCSPETITSLLISYTSTENKKFKLKKKVLARKFHKRRCGLSLGSACVYFVALAAVAEKVMATHSSTLAWKIPWMEEPGRLQSMGS